MLKKVTTKRVLLAMGALALSGAVGYDLFLHKNKNTPEHSVLTVEEERLETDNKQEDAANEEEALAENPESDTDTSANDRKSRAIRDKKMDTDKTKRAEKESDKENKCKKEEGKRTEKIKQEKQNGKKEKEHIKSETGEDKKSKEKKPNKKEKTGRIVNINTASAAELAENLKGIGESKAEKIVSYRNEKGNFSNIEEIKNVKGIGDKIFEKIKDQIVV
jgi:competence protein ComEA helix-hairpin-helix repeat region